MPFKKYLTSKHFPNFLRINVIYELKFLKVIVAIYLVRLIIFFIFHSSYLNLVYLCNTQTCMNLFFIVRVQFSMDKLFFCRT
jgi:hypothetical protein